MTLHFLDRLFERNQWIQRIIIYFFVFFSRFFYQKPKWQLWALISWEKMWHRLRLLNLFLNFENSFLNQWESDRHTIIVQVRKGEQQLKQKDRSNWNVTLTSLAASQSSLTSANVLSIVDQVLSNGLIDISSLVFLGSTDMELKTDFLNRVRINTLPGRQVSNLKCFRGFK